MGYVCDVLVVSLCWGLIGIIGVIVLCLIDIVMVMLYEVFVWVVVWIGWFVIVVILDDDFVVDWCVVDVLLNWGVDGLILFIVC